ncbi:MAG: hypothetical protein K2Y56_05065 [Methylobacterium sp.]|uniref:hypothetical protein n=1 Tax=Methylobacterium sp. TaxID=409 RepID=UPI0025CFF0C6|nr:hypothetical protein [Methylobacterium sp.]MBX9930895.1 hypothetical protein [Methylobacterium sp.]
MTAEILIQGVNSEDGPRCYRAVALYKDGRILHEVTFSAHGDESALVIAKSMVDSHAIDLWEGLRFIEQFEPANRDA